MLRTLRKSANPSCFKALHSKVFSLADLCSVVPSARIYDMLSILLIPDYQHGCMWHLLCSEWYKDHFMACIAEAEKSEAPTIISLIYILFSLPFVFVFVSEDHFFFSCLDAHCIISLSSKCKRCFYIMSSDRSAFINFFSLKT